MSWDAFMLDLVPVLPAKKREVSKGCASGVQIEEKSKRKTHRITTRLKSKLLMSQKCGRSIGALLSPEPVFDRTPARSEETSCL